MEPRCSVSTGRLITAKGSQSGMSGEKMPPDGEKAIPNLAKDALKLVR
jgi:hypothetical protein